ncbi:phosphoserine phosphatase SerB [Phenylobacterium sp.]|uniref:phosphoserine phosphatase SerB n=1 Tax=Phenylobacterium sp. TaxID=1871053 RepID=UPI002601B372|nr:phosphoserine phosphatase SerB [Phenylobacterium sp.]
MQLALTLVSPARGAAQGALAGLAQALAGAQARVKEPRPLGPLAIDVAVEAEGETAVREAAEGALAGRPIDVCVQPWNGRRKRLLVADMDSTIINVECLDELADFAGLKPHIAAITERAMRGELEFETALRERVALLRGLPVSALQRTFDERVRLNPGARTLVRTMAAGGARCVLVSGGFSFFTGRVAAAAGFHAERANVLIEESGTLAGLVAEPILGREAKLQTLLQEAEALDLALSEILAVGDGANDLAMIEVAGLGVAYRAKPIVAAQANARVDHADLTALLHFQGYRDSEFVTD